MRTSRAILLSLCVACGWLALASAQTPCTDYSNQTACSSVAPVYGTLPACGPFTANDPRIESRFVVLGDYGLSGPNCERHVALLIDQLERQFGRLDFILTTGDNNYWNGDCSSIQSNIGDLYSKYMPPRTDSSCVDPPLPRPVPTPSFNQSDVRFYPSLGNHDWDTHHDYPYQLPYVQFFSYLSSYAPAVAGTYYTFQPVPAVQLFAVNSNLKSGAEYDQQKQWLTEALSNSTAPFKFVYFHHPPFSTAEHDALAPWMDMPFADMGATTVFCGHQHVYERIQRDIPYVINGLGGHPWLYDITHCTPTAGSQARYNDAHGAVLGLVSRSAGAYTIDYCLYTTDSTVGDYFNQTVAPSVPPTTLAPTTTTTTTTAAPTTTTVAPTSPPATTLSPTPNNNPATDEPPQPPSKDEHSPVVIAASAVGCLLVLLLLCSSRGRLYCTNCLVRVQNCCLQSRMWLRSLCCRSRAPRGAVSVAYVSVERPDGGLDLGASPDSGPDSARFSIDEEEMV